MIRTAFFLVFLSLLLSGCTEPKRQPPTVVSEPPLSATTPATGSGTASGAASGATAAPRPSAFDIEPEPPYADPFDLARRLQGRTVPVEALTQPPPAQPGDLRDFWVYELDSPPRAIAVPARLILSSDHADFWVQADQNVGRDAIERAARRFEEDIYPRVTAAFGPPATAPGGSPGRISILHIRIRGAGGYFSASDQLPRAIAPYSNEQQIIYIDLNAARPGDAGYAGLVAHELQHLVHQQGNAYADTWLTEGLSEVANELLGGNNALLRRFETAANTQLTTWPAEANPAPHYGAAHSFLRYVLQHYGGIERARDLLTGDARGVNSVERYLRANGFGVGFLDVFADWTVANLLDAPGDGRYAQIDIDHRTRDIDRATRDAGSLEVAQFGARYLEVEPDGRARTLTLDGDDTIGRLPAQAASDSSFYWSNRADSMDATLTREIDLTGVRTATLNFKLWFDIETDYDYAYAAVSRDNGATWTLLRGSHMTDSNPVESAYGPGYSGKSGGGNQPRWVDETIDLTPFAGSRILLRFEYVTDQATTADGLALDDLAIPEINWRDDAERDGVWTLDGFLRLSEPLSQRYIVHLVEEAADGATNVRRIDLDPTNRAEIPISATARRATVVIAGATLGTTQPSTVNWSLR